MAIFSTLWNCKDSKQEDFKVTYPEEELGVIKAKYTDGTLAIGGFNRGYRNYKEKHYYPWSLKITMALNSEKCNPNGLPMDGENELANKFEDELVENLSNISPIHNVGHLFNNNYLDIYLYVRDKNKIDEWLEMEIQKEKLIRSFNYELIKDENWSTTANFMSNN